MVETPRVQYVYLDIVGFTKNRSVEAQSDIVAKLNEIVREVLQEETDVAPGNQVFLPTGDGMAIGLLNPVSVDAHLMTALGILDAIAEHNEKTQDEMRQFNVRIGLNENMDNVITDVNGMRNLAGAGISRAQRVMDKADARQILVGQTVNEVLQQREKYLGKFKQFYTKDKHGSSFPVYQFVGEAIGLDIEVPSAFRVDSEEDDLKLTDFVAYYLAHAAVNKPFLGSLVDSYKRDTACVTLLVMAHERLIS